MERNAFGYRPEDRTVHGPPVGLQVVEAKDAATLQPQVIVYFRWAEDEDQEGVALGVEQAEALAAELIRWANRGREKHWE